ncbi:hypothetical protein AQI84_41910 [Streptomyces griseorubiginosus]|uniref:Uncharacterized protein n=1 Tax=Streptomyces griseorubiginosus TaxID=67304 RepID=A0A124GTS9_9ACTN|nr:hypothetical protein AQI84_41910 [Streptomyces griseorubiginosus]KUN57962.1 hypothetical protein AQJ54_42890 [Streptomyces griseorubiginosus]
MREVGAEVVVGVDAGRVVLGCLFVEGRVPGDAGLFGADARHAKLAVAGSQVWGARASGCGVVARTLGIGISGAVRWQRAAAGVWGACAAGVAS